MERDDDALGEIAASQSVDPAAARTLLDELRAQAGGGPYYVFLSGGRGSGARGGGRRSRTLVAFATPDLALAFAQRNQLAQPGSPPRLRRLSLGRLLLAMLREPAIATLHLVRDDASLVGGQLPDGLTLSRDEALARLQAPGI